PPHRGPPPPAPVAVAAPTEAAPSEPAFAVVPAVATPPAVAAPFEDPLAQRVLRGSLGRGQTPAEPLAPPGVAPDRIHVLVSEMAPVLDFRYSRPGDRYELWLSPADEITRFRHQSSPHDYSER